MNNRSEKRLVNKRAQVKKTAKTSSLIILYWQNFSQIDIYYIVNILMELFLREYKTLLVMCFFFCIA